MKKMIILTILLLTSLITMAFGCKNPKIPLFKIDFNGQEFFYKDAAGKEPKTEYKAGERVLLYFDFVATDTNYYFYMDDESFNPGWDGDKHAYIIDFIMPEHDVKLFIDHKNSMRYDPSERIEE